MDTKDQWPKSDSPIRIGFIDPGLRNLSYLIVEISDEDYHIWRWIKKDICPGKKISNLTTQELYDSILDFLDTCEDLRSCQDIYLELQMTSKYKAITAMVYAYFHGRCNLISPFAAKRHFSLNQGNHALNKRAVVEWVSNHPDLKGPDLELFRSVSKKDDMADCYLMFKYVQSRFGLCKTHLKKTKKRKREGQE